MDPAQFLHRKIPPQFLHRKNNLVVRALCLNVTNVNTLMRQLVGPPESSTVSPQQYAAVSSRDKQNRLEVFYTITTCTLLGWTVNSAFIQKKNERTIEMLSQKASLVPTTDS